MPENDKPISDDVEDVIEAESESGSTGNDAGEENSTALAPITPWDQIRQQLGLPNEEFALMVSTSNFPPQRHQIILAKRIVQTYGLPVTGFNIIRVKVKGGYKDNVYINSYGIGFRLHLDRRGFKANIGRITHMPTDEEPWIAACAKVEMKDGSYAENESYTEWPITNPDSKDRGFTLGNMCKKLITQAKRRAGADLVGTGLPVYDEYLEKGYIEGEYHDIEEPKQIKPPKESPDTIPELLAMAQDQHDMGLEDLLRLMEVATLSELNVKETWDKIRRTHESEQPTETPNSEGSV